MSTAESTTSLPTLETTCKVCGGIGGYSDWKHWCRCGSCDGRGYIPTDAGNMILSLLRHNLTLMQELAATKG